MNFQQAGFGRAAQKYEQAALDEVHVAVAQATVMSRAEMREGVGATSGHFADTHGLTKKSMSDSLVTMLLSSSSAESSTRVEGSPRSRGTSIPPRRSMATSSSTFASL